MATLYWRGDAVAVKQIATVQITAFDAATTYEITIGGVVVSVPGNTDVNTTASDLQVALEASTHPYFSNIDWTVVTDTVTATAGTAGVPFVATSSVMGGTGTIGAVTETTPSAGPNDWSTGDNWETVGSGQGTVPASTDDVIIENSSVSIAYGLDQNAVALDSLRIDKSFTGKIGLSVKVFATSADGATTVATANEYRETYLKIGSEVVDIGQKLGPGTATGSTRIKINNVDAAASTTTIHDTASSGDGIYPAIRLLNTNSGSTLFVRKAPGGVGIAVDRPGETTTFSSITISDTSAGSKVFTGKGLTLTTWIQNGGNHSLRIVDAGTLATCTINGGTLLTNGDFTITTLNVNGGVVNALHGVSGVVITTVNLNGGSANARGSSTARTWTTVNMGVDASLAADSNLTITNLNEPSDPYRLQTTSL